MKKYLLNISILSLVLLFVLGCGAINQLKKGVEEASKPEVVTSTDGLIQVTIPAGWNSNLKLNDMYSIQAGNLFAEQYLAAFSESKIDYSDDIDLDDYLRMINQNIQDSMQILEMSEVKDVKIGGLDAKRFEVSGVIEDLKISYIYNLIDSKDHFHQVVTWTLSSRFSKNRTIFLETIDTFKLNEPGTRLDPPKPAPEN